MRARGFEPRGGPIGLDVDSPKQVGQPLPDMGRRLVTYAEETGPVPLSQIPYDTTGVNMGERIKLTGTPHKQEGTAWGILADAGK